LILVLLFPYFHQGGLYITFGLNLQLPYCFKDVVECEIGFDRYK